MDWCSKELRIAHRLKVKPFPEHMNTNAVAVLHCNSLLDTFVVYPPIAASLLNLSVQFDIDYIFSAFLRHCISSLSLAPFRLCGSRPCCVIPAVAPLWWCNDSRGCVTGAGLASQIHFGEEEKTCQVCKTFFLKLLVAGSYEPTLCSALFFWYYRTYSVFVKGIYSQLYLRSF